MVQDEYDSSARTGAQGRASSGTRSAWSLEDDDILAALRTTGLTAPLVVDGDINGELFVGWVRSHLVPTLHPGDIVLMDNLGSHKGAGVREAITTARVRLVYLPPYNPEQPNRPRLREVQVAVEDRVSAIG